MSEKLEPAAWDNKNIRNIVQKGRPENTGNWEPLVRVSDLVSRLKRIRPSRQEYLPTQAEKLDRKIMEIIRELEEVDDQ